MAVAINKRIKKLQYERIRKLEKRKRGEPPEFIFNGNYSLEEIELFLHFRKEGKNMLKTEEINNSECTGYLILDGDNLIVRVEKNRKTKEIYCYIYADSNDDDFTAKFKIN
ncbi:hypothetical protein [Enterococcus phage vB_EfaM_Ef2.1]|nr:hypothetical protein [Enterococcus phage vB_EfaM_Ef2.1]